eukprot:Rmarinus@m.12301
MEVKELPISEGKIELLVSEEHPVSVSPVQSNQSPSPGGRRIKKRLPHKEVSLRAALKHAVTSEEAVFTNILHDHATRPIVQPRIPAHLPWKSSNDGVELSPTRNSPSPTQKGGEGGGSHPYAAPIRSLRRPRKPVLFGMTSKSAEKGASAEINKQMEELSLLPPEDDLSFQERAIVRQYSSSPQPNRQPGPVSRMGVGLSKGLSPPRLQSLLKADPSKPKQGKRVNALLSPSHAAYRDTFSKHSGASINNGLPVGLRLDGEMAGEEGLFKSAITLCEMKLAQSVRSVSNVEGGKPSASVTASCFEILDAALPLLGAFSGVLAEVRDQLFQAIYSNVLTSEASDNVAPVEPTSGEMESERRGSQPSMGFLPYFAYVSHLEENIAKLTEERDGLKKKLQDKVTEEERLHVFLNFKGGDTRSNFEKLVHKLNQQESSVNELRDMYSSVHEEGEALQKGLLLQHYRYNEQSMRMVEKDKTIETLMSQIDALQSELDSWKAEVMDARVKYATCIDLANHNLIVASLENRIKLITRQFTLLKTEHRKNMLLSARISRELALSVPVSVYNASISRYDRLKEEHETLIEHHRILTKEHRRDRKIAQDLLSYKRYLTPRPRWDRATSYLPGPLPSSTQQAVTTLLEEIDKLRGNVVPYVQLRDFVDPASGVSFYTPLQDSRAPAFMQAEEKVRKRSPMYRDLSAMMREVWAHREGWKQKQLYGRGKKISFSQYFQLYLKERFGVLVRIAEYAYNLVEGLMRYPHDFQCRTFLDTLFDRVSEDVYFAQLRKESRVKTACRNADRNETKGGKLKGSVRRKVMIDGIYAEYPARTEEQIAELSMALNMCTDPESGLVDYEKAFQPKRDGMANEFQRVLRRHVMEEREDMLVGMSVITKALSLQALQEKRLEATLRKKEKVQGADHTTPLLRPRRDRRRSSVRSSAAPSPIPSARVSAAARPSPSPTALPSLLPSQGAPTPGLTSRTGSDSARSVASTVASVVSTARTARGRRAKKMGLKLQLSSADLELEPEESLMVNVDIAKQALAALDPGKTPAEVTAMVAAGFACDTQDLEKNASTLSLSYPMFMANFRLQVLTRSAPKTFPRLSVDCHLVKAMVKECGTRPTRLQRFEDAGKNIRYTLRTLALCVLAWRKLHKGVLTIPLDLPADPERTRPADVREVLGEDAVRTAISEADKVINKAEAGPKRRAETRSDVPSETDSDGSVSRYLADQLEEVARQQRAQGSARGKDSGKLLGNREATNQRSSVSTPPTPGGEGDRAPTDASPLAQRSTSDAVGNFALGGAPQAGNDTSRSSARDRAASNYAAVTARSDGGARSQSPTKRTEQMAASGSGSASPHSQGGASPTRSSKPSPPRKPKRGSSVSPVRKRTTAKKKKQKKNGKDERPVGDDDWEGGRSSSEESDPTMSPQRSFTKPIDAPLLSSGGVPKIPLDEAPDSYSEARISTPPQPPSFFITDASPRV